jgi:hypothetical protein
MKADVVVVGGGMAGITAALAAAQGGANVLLTDENGCFGGTATVSMLGELNGYTHHGQKIYGGVTAEIIDTMVSQGLAYLKYDIPMTGDPSILVDRVRYEPELMKLFLDELLMKAEVGVLLHSRLTGIEPVGEESYKVILTNKHQSIEVESSIVIDATGNADAVHKAGRLTWKPGKQESQAVSLIFRMSGIDSAAYQEFPVTELRKMILTGYDQGFLPAKYCAINLIAGTNDAIVNMTRVNGVDHESMADMTRAEIKARQQISIAVSYLKEHWPGFKNAYLSAIAPSVGVREARRINGRYTLTQEDILSGRKFADTVAIGCYPMDIHGKISNSVDFTPIGGDGIYAVPFGSLLPAGMERVLVAGKCISVDEGAFAAIRIIPTVMAIGEAAGTAAALALKYGVPPHAIEVNEVQKILKARGHLLPV